MRVARRRTGRARGSPGRGARCQCLVVRELLRLFGYAAHRGLTATPVDQDPYTTSTEREDVSAHARVPERDLEGALGDWPSVADELVHPRFGDRSLAGRVDVEAAVVAGRPAGEAHG